VLPVSNGYYYCSLFLQGLQCKSELSPQFAHSFGHMLCDYVSDFVHGYFACLIKSENCWYYTYFKFVYQNMIYVAAANWPVRFVAAELPALCKTLSLCSYCSGHKQASASAVGTTTSSLPLGCPVPIGVHYKKCFYKVFSLKSYSANYIPGFENQYFILKS